MGPDGSFGLSLSFQPLRQGDGNDCLFATRSKFVMLWIQEIYCFHI